MSNNRITFKKFKTFKAGSQETLCFTAVVCLDGEEICHADNDGRGGCNNYLPVEGKNWADFKRLKEVAIAMLPDEKFKDLDCVIDQIMIDMEKAKFHANQLKKCQFAIVGQQEDSYSIFSPFKEKVDLGLAIKNEQYAVHIMDCVQKLRDNGFTILNTNLSL